MSVKKLVLGSREEWLQARKNHIGGSDASACVGMNPYKSNVELWEEKSGLRLSEDISKKEYVIYGTKAEDYLRELFILDFPAYQIFYDDNNMFLNSDFPWMHASLDGELVDQNGRKGILEIKTTNLLQSMQKEKWKDRIPDNYFCQVLHYLAVTGYEFVVLKAQLKSEWGGELRIATKHYFIERKDVEEDIKYLVDAEKRFWNCVELGRRPDLILPAI
ncbi:YqaJ viral recombinase family protein [Clostridium sp. HBUAS56010]|uniref:YqaJ viral recombinase family nuclease n=1 Tax=Clostridium sp. HBUAS56010 TaxID=2571127 RepID=UPI001178847C|nr:YqaJ viral recombinase family protein [Clostridium sp. HBUAS56010]